MFESLNRKLEAAKRRADEERAAARPAHDSTMSADGFRRGNQALPDGSKVPTGSVAHQTATPPRHPPPEAPAQPGEALVQDASNGNGKNRAEEPEVPFGQRPIADARLVEPSLFFRRGWTIDHLPGRLFETMDGQPPREDLANVQSVIVTKTLPRLADVAALLRQQRPAESNPDGADAVRYFLYGQWIGYDPAKPD